MRTNRRTVPAFGVPGSATAPATTDGLATPGAQSGPPGPTLSRMRSDSVRVPVAPTPGAGAAALAAVSSRLSRAVHPVEDGGSAGGGFGIPPSRRPLSAFRSDVSAGPPAALAILLASLFPLCRGVPSVTPRLLRRRRA